MSFLSSIFGSKPKREHVSTLSGPQQNLLNQITGGIQGQLGQGQSQAIQYLMDILSGQGAGVQALEAPTRRSFQEQTIPQLLEAYTSQGARSSSGLQQALAQAGQRLEEGLGAQRATLQQDAVRSLLNQFLAQSQLGLGTKSFETLYSPQRPSFLQSLTQGLIPFGQSYAQGLGQQAGLRQLLSLLGA